MYLQLDINEKTYKAYLKIHDVGRKLPFYSSDIGIEEKREFLRSVGLSEIEVWCDNVSVGEVSVDDLKKYELNNAAGAVEAQIHRAVLDYRKKLREEKGKKAGAVQGEFKFSGAVNDEYLI